VEGNGRGLIVRYYPIICLEELRKAMKNLSQDSRSPGRDLNLGPPECEAGLLTTQSLRLVFFIGKESCFVTFVCTGHSIIF
jgi:hypothetical protein